METASTRPPEPTSAEPCWLAREADITASDRVGTTAEGLPVYAMCRHRLVSRLLPLTERPAAVVVHGTSTAYRNRGCRCEACRMAATEQQRRYVAAMRSRMENAPHGTDSGYRNWGCRCELCREAARAKRRDAGRAS